MSLNLLRQRDFIRWFDNEEKTTDFDLRQIKFSGTFRRKFLWKLLLVWILPTVWDSVFTLL